ncbi:hypothetical protein GCM10020000_02130 [Streptomyces olivoverticillatus]
MRAPPRRPGTSSEATPSDYQRALHAGYVLIAGYTITLVSAFALGRRTIAHSPRHHCPVVAGMIASAAAGLLAVAGNLLLSHGLRHLASSGDVPFAAAAGCAAVRWLLLGLTVPVAAVVIAVTFKRAVLHLINGPRPKSVPGDVIPPWPVIRDDGHRWPTTRRTHPELSKAARWRNGSRVPPGREPGALGICASGGGIRSACVTLGALQSLREELLQARYLVSVSGGGYTVGAFQLALSGRSHSTEDPSSAGVTPEDVFEPGSPEEDHMRRHSKYLADGTGQWLRALGVLLRGLLASLILLAVTVLVLGLALSWAYHCVPLTRLDGLYKAGLSFPPRGPAPALPGFRGPALLAIVAFLGAAAICWLLWLLTFTWARRSDRLARWLLRAFVVAVVLGLLLAVVLVVLPLLAWATVHLQHGLALSQPQAGAGAGAAAASTYLALLATTMWRRRQTARRGWNRALNLGRGNKGLTRAVPNGIMQYLFVWLVLLVLTVAGLLLLGWAVATAWHWHWGVADRPPRRPGLDRAEPGPDVAEPSPLLPRSAGLRVRRPPPGRPGQGGARGALRLQDRTHAAPLVRPQTRGLSPGHLRRGGQLVRQRPHPAGQARGVVHVLARLRRRPGHRLRPHRAPGRTHQTARQHGPDGAVRRRRLGRGLRFRDGAPGTGVPDPPGPLQRPPRHLAAQPGRARLPVGAAQRLAAAPPQPTIRRLPYLLREISGRYPMDDRLLLTTDGGHYDNLGLVELLRHGVRTAICIDSTPASAHFAATLGEAITLAYEELGVKIVLPDEWRNLVPGSATPLQPEDPLATLNVRLSADVVVTGRIIYPQELNFGNEGTLILARATLTSAMPYHLLAYASAREVFPHDSTGDQWFDHRQFDAYQALGRYLGRQAKEAYLKAQTTQAKKA